MTKEPSFAQVDQPAIPVFSGLWERLKTETRTAHQRLDQAITGYRPFESVQRYGQFVLMQHDFHHATSPLYQDAGLGTLIKDLGTRDRLAQIEGDLRDLGLATPPQSPAVGVEDLHMALGWVYVAEGSNLGAAFLLKAAYRLDLSETFGARHLAAAPEGRSAHWKSFTAALDSLQLEPREQDKVVCGANAAFVFVHGLVEQRFAALAA